MVPVMPRLPGRSGQVEAGRRDDGGINGAWDEYLMKMVLADTIEGHVENGKAGLLRACASVASDALALGSQAAHQAFGWALWFP